MLLQILFNPISLITSLLSTHSMYYNSLSEVDVESEYTKAGFVTENFYLLKSDTEMNYKNGFTYCMSQKMVLFTTSADMNLSQVFAHFNATKIWTQVYEHDISKLLVNFDTTPPQTSLIDGVLSLPLEKPPANHLVSLEKIDGTYQFVNSLVSEEKTVICMSQLPFPNTTKDRKSIQNLKQVILNDLLEAKTHVEMVKGLVNRKLLVIPKLGKLADIKKNWTLNNTELIDLDQKIVRKITNELGTKVLPIIKQWKNIENSENFAILSAKHFNYVNTLKGITAEILNPMLHPFSAVEWEDRDKVDPTIEQNWEPLMGISENEEGNYLFIHFKETNVNDSLPIFRASLTFKYIDSKWVGFFKLTFMDILLTSVTLGPLTCFMVYSAIRICMYIFRKAAKKLDYYKYKRRSSSIDSRLRQFTVKKSDSTHTTTSFLPDSPRRKNRTPRRLGRSRSFSIEHESKMLRPKKRHAPPPPVALPIRQERYRAPKKPRNEPYYKIVRVINDDLPVGDGDSFLGD